jgi:hypothetical protein
VEIVVADDRGGSVAHSFQITVNADNQAPKVELFANRTPASLGDDVVFRSATATTSRSSSAAHRRRTERGPRRNGNATVTRPSSAGCRNGHGQDAAGLSATATIQVFVMDPTPAAAAVHSPDDGAWPGARR